MTIKIKSKEGSKKTTKKGKPEAPHTAKELLKGLAATGTVELSGPQGISTLVHDFPIEVKGDTPLANVNVVLGHTKNLGNYESVKLQCSLTLPSLPQKNSLDATFEWAKKWVDEKLTVLIEDVEKELK